MPLTSSSRPHGLALQRRAAASISAAARARHRRPRVQQHDRAVAVLLRRRRHRLHERSSWAVRAAPNRWGRHPSEHVAIAGLRDGCRAPANRRGRRPRGSETMAAGCMPVMSVIVSSAAAMSLAMPSSVSMRHAGVVKRVITDQMSVGGDLGRASRGSRDAHRPCMKKVARTLLGRQCVEQPRALRCPSRQIGVLGVDRERDPQVITHGS